MKHPSQFRSLRFALLLLATPAFAQEPGDVYKEYLWKYGPWQRVVGHDASNPLAKRLLPNPVNTIILGDMQESIRAEVQLEKLTSHAGTVKPKIRINGNDWLDIPDPDPALVPGSKGTFKNIRYLTMFYPKVSVPLSHLREGTNKFELTCQGKGGQSFAKQWPQFVLYAATFRIYYDPAKKPHATGRITSPRAGSVLSDDPVIEASVTGSVNRVDFIGDYYDFDWRGDGTPTGWQLDYHYGKMQHNIGYRSRSPWRVTWDTDWIPTQTRPFRLAARIRGSGGIYYITPPVDGVSLSRSKTVIRYQNTEVPKNWVANFWHPYKEATTHISDDLSKAESARMFGRTWNGRQCDEIGINGARVASYVGKAHELDWTQTAIPVRGLQQGSNKIYTKGSLMEHGVEVLWPGFEIFVRYNIPESVSEFVPFGVGCSSAKSAPSLSAVGRPAIGTVFNLEITGAPANGLTFLAWGVSNELDALSPLPLPLASLGAPGCTLWSSMDLLLPGKADAGGKQSLPLAIPNMPGLIGKYFFKQAVVADPTANSAGMLVSNSARILVGK